MKFIRRLLISTLVLVALLTILYFVLESKIQQYVVHSFNSVVTSHLDYRLSAKNVTVDIFNKSVQVDSLVAIKESGDGLITFDRVVLEINLSNILMNNVKFTRILLESPTVSFKSKSDLILEKKQSDKIFSNELIDFEIEQLEVRNGQIVYQMDSSAISTPKFSFSLYDLSNNFTQTQQNGFEFSVNHESGLNITWNGNSSNLNRSTGIISVENFQLDSNFNIDLINNIFPEKYKKNRKIVELLSNYKLSSVVNFSTVYDVSFVDSLDVQLRKGRIELNNSHIWNDSLKLYMSNILIDDIELSSDSMVAKFPKIYANIVDVTSKGIWQDVDGIVALKPLLFDRTIDSWKIDVDQLSVFHLTYVNSSLPLEFIHLEDMKLNFGSKIKMTTKLDYDSLSNVDIIAKIGRRNNQIDIIFDSVTLVSPFVEKISSRLSDISLVHGVCKGKLQATFNNDSSHIANIKIKSSFLVDSLVAYNRSKRFVECGELYVEGVTYFENNLNISSLKALRPYADITIEKGTVPVKTLLGLTDEFDRTFDRVEKLSIGKVEVENGQFRVSDPTLFNEYSLFIQDVNGTVKSLKSGSYSPINIKGWFDDNSNLQVLGKVDLLSANPKYNFEVFVYNLELTTFQNDPFVYGGYEIMKGLVDMKAMYSPNRDGSVGRKVDVNLYKLNVGKKLYETGMKLPISAGTTMLSDKNGDLDFNFQIRNNLDKTDIKVSDYLLKAFSNSIVKAFKKIGNLFKKEQKFNPIIFKPMETFISKKARKELDIITRILKNHRKLQLNIAGHYSELDQLNDPEEYVLKTIGERLNLRFDNITREELLSTYKEEFCKFYCAVYQIPKSKRKQSSIQLMTMYNNMIDSDDLLNKYRRELALRRAKCVKNFLVQEKGVKASALFITNPITENNLGNALVTFSEIK